MSCSIIIHLQKMEESGFKLGGIFLSLGICKHVIQESEQFIRVDWFFDKKIGPTILGFEFKCGPFVDCSHKYDFGLIEIRVLFDHLAELEAMYLGYQHVADHCIRTFLFCLFISLGSILGAENLVFVAGKNHPKHGEGDSIIVYNKYFSFHLFPSVDVLEADNI